MQTNTLFFNLSKLVQLHRRLLLMPQHPNHFYYSQRSCGVSWQVWLCRFPYLRINTQVQTGDANQYPFFFLSLRSFYSFKDTYKTTTTHTWSWRSLQPGSEIPFANSTPLITNVHRKSKLGSVLLVGDDYLIPWIAVCSGNFSFRPSRTVWEIPRTNCNPWYQIFLKC